MRIEVTEDDIRCGIRGSCQLCAVALAAKRAGFVGAVVGRGTVKVGSKVAHLPSVARQFIDKFDAHGPKPGPIAFDLPPLDDPAWEEIGVRKEGGA